MAGRYASAGMAVTAILDCNCVVYGNGVPACVKVCVGAGSCCTARNPSTAGHGCVPTNKIVYPAGRILFIESRQPPNVWPERTIVPCALSVREPGVLTVWFAGTVPPVWPLPLYWIVILGETPNGTMAAGEVKKNSYGYVSYGSYE